MSKNIKFSIIIPVYNVSTYLRQCVDSVLNQDYDNFEIILVDDGSTDESGAICDEYEVSYPHIVKCIHKSNGGLSDARNAGIKNSTGHYLMFVDGDDFLIGNYVLSTSYKRLSQNKCDVLIYLYSKYFEYNGSFDGHIRTALMPRTLLNKCEQIDFLFQNNFYFASACNKIINKDLFDYDLNFETDVYSEDIEWCAKLLIKAKNFDFIGKDFYAYRQRANSISHSINNKKCTDLCNHIISCIKMAEAADENIKKYILIFSAYQFGTFFKVQAIADNFQDDLLNQLKEYKWILKFHNKNKKILILYILTKFLGFKFTCRLLRFLYGIKRSK